jgi:glycosyltransferase involved in cell wall biosynthesis
MLEVLSVAYRLAPVSPGVAGGAEQVLAALDRALVQAGHRSVVLACEGSSVAGELAAVPIGVGPLSEARRAHATVLFRRRLVELVRQHRFDVIHFHGMDASDYPLGEAGLREVPKLVTLHVPLEWYAPELFRVGGNLSFNAVSAWQREQIGRAVTLRTSIDNGVDLSAWRPVPRPTGGYVVCLGRICREKGFDLALRAVRQADVSLLLAGQAFAYPEHERYFAEEIQPALDERRRFIGAVSGEQKRQLLAHASALVVPSRVAETCSLVTLEALACGTPVIAPAHGAPSRWLEPGVSGWVATGEVELAAALGRLDGLQREACRNLARRFDVREMARRYFELYAELASSSRRGRRAGFEVKHA